MSQPTQRHEDLEAVGELDEERGEFWIENPWKMNALPYNVSAYEPNQVFLNLGSTTFAEVGFQTTTDSEGDGRGAMAADIDGDLQPDLLVRHAGGGPLTVWANRFPPASRLIVSLEGRESNALGIGAVITAVADGREVVRQMFPTNNFASSQPAMLDFGLGDAERVDRLEILWPSGERQVLRDLEVNRHLRITEGDDSPRVLYEARPAS